MQLTNGDKSVQEYRYVCNEYDIAISEFFVVIFL